MDEEEIEIHGESKIWYLKRCRLLGKGTFANAILYEEKDGRKVVLKDMDLRHVHQEDEKSALRREISIMKKVSGHPNMVFFLDSYDDGEYQLYIIMDYYQNGDLSQHIDKFLSLHEPIPSTFITMVYIQLLVAIYYLHTTHRILHRDIKSANIFLSSDGTIRLGDFGVAQELSSGECKAQAYAGSPLYMAPEICRERAYDGRADIWSIGIVLYELVMQHRPFDGSTLPSLSSQICSGVFKPIPDDKSNCPAPIRSAIHGMLRTNPSIRPTLKRLLHSTFVNQQLSLLPEECRKHPYYIQLFGENLKTDSSPVRGVQSASGPPNNLLNELEAWSMENKSGSDAFTGLLMKTGTINLSPPTKQSTLVSVSKAPPPPRSISMEYDDDFENSMTSSISSSEHDD